MKPRIAIFSGATATIQNSAPLITSNKARTKYGLPARTLPDGSPLPFDELRPQRLAAPVTVYVEQFSAHPLERDAAELYAPPDGYIDTNHVFHKERQSADDVPVYEVTLDPSDGLYLLPYMARQASGAAWDREGTSAMAPAEQTRQTFYPNASRIFEEIDRLGVGGSGAGNLLAAKADFDFFRAVPSGGYKKGLPAAQRTDHGDGDISPETLGVDFFGYRPAHLSRSPQTTNLARLTNVVQQALRGDTYAGAIWLEGSPNVEETIYWLSLVIDTTVTIVGNAAQRPHGTVSADGDRNIIDSLNYILSRPWADAEGRDEIGAVAIQDEQIFTAREVQKGDARPGGYTATGGHGGIIGTVNEQGPALLTFKPANRKHTWRSDVNLSRIPSEVQGVQRVGDQIKQVPVQVKDADGRLLAAAIPHVRIEKTARYLPVAPNVSPEPEVEILATIDHNLQAFPLAGFVAEGTSPYGSMTESAKAALELAALSGMPVVRVGRGNAEGFATPRTERELRIAGNNLTATKARLLLMACLLRFGSLPPARDPAHPTDAELKAVTDRIAEYQEVFNTH